MTIYPTYRSGLMLVEPRFFASTRESVLGSEVSTSVIDAYMDADIDRAGPKSRITITGIDPDQLTVNQWIAPFIRIVPEIGDIIDTQMGLYQLDEPSIEHRPDGTSIVENHGEDAVSILAASVMGEAYTIPQNLLVRNEIAFSIEMGTCGRVSRNLITVNPSFASQYTGWTTASGGAWIGTWATIIAAVYPAGSAVRMRHDAATPLNSYAYITSDSVAITPGTKTVVFSSWVYVEAGQQVAIYTVINGVTESLVMAYRYPEYTFKWHRLWAYYTVPDGTETLSFRVYSRWDDTEATTRSTYLSKMEMREIIGSPITRYSIPADARYATSPIVHEPSDTYLRRINDALAALGMHALTSSLNGSYLARPLRDIASDTPTRTYTMGEDVRMIGDIQTRASRGNVYNHVVAVKEDYTTGTALVAVASNDDPDHPWSTVNRGMISIVVTISDAVDTDALQSIANDKLARASMQEEVIFTVAPDASLTYFDVIEIVGTTGREAGRWAIEAIRTGLTSDDPLIELSARRTVTSSQAG